MFNQVIPMKRDTDMDHYLIQFSIRLSLFYRLICRETRRIAERQMRAADSVLHLEEFDDEVR